MKAAAAVAAAAASNTSPERKPDPAPPPPKPKKRGGGDVFVGQGDVRGNVAAAEQGEGVSGGDVDRREVRERVRVPVFSKTTLRKRS